MVRGAPSNNNFIMYYPGYEKGFGFLRNTGIDQHVVARERLPDLADSIIPKFPDLLAISEDEGTAWVVKGDTGTIVGRNKAFVYGARVSADAGKPFLTLHPGDKYDLAARKVIRRAADDAPVSEAYVDSLFKKYSDPSLGGATVLVARGGNVFIDKSYGIGPQAKYMPTTTVPQFVTGGIGEVFNAICSQLPAAPARGRGGNAANPDSTQPARGGGRAQQPPSTPLQTCVSRVRQPLGAYKTNANAEGQVLSNVDELYRLALGLENPRTYGRDAGQPAPGAAPNPIDYTKGWQTDTYKGVSRLSAFGADGGKRSVFVRMPDQQATIIVLTNDDSFDAKAAADRITDRLIARK